MDKNFGGVIWTDHAIHRLKEREVKQSDAWATFRRPEQARYAQSKGAWVYYKTCGNKRIEVVAKQNEKKEWIILSVWSKTMYGNKPKTKTNKKPDLMDKILDSLLGRFRK